ncbi:transcription elongation factor GreA, partial [Streptococcus pneumoniae]
MKRCSSRYIFILFEQLFKPRQRRLAVGMVTD